jgi:protein phosphatase
MKLEVHATSDVGYVRTQNEDMALVGHRFVRDDRMSAFHEVLAGRSPYLLAVADGLGGHSAGEIASRDVLEALRSEIAELEANLAPAAVIQRLTEIAGRIQNGLLTRGSSSPGRQGMSTTLTSVLIYEDQFFLLHAGDSRCYVLRNEMLRQVTRDHTLREFSGDPSIPGNILVNCFGIQEEFFTDTQQFGSEGDSGDVFLICSDGLTDMVSDEQIEATLRDAESMEHAGDSLLEQARGGGAADNITFVLARVL